MGMGMGKKGKVSWIYLKYRIVIMQIKKIQVVIQGHPLILKQYYEVTHCNQCQTIIWGVSPQGYHCTGLYLFAI